MMPPTRSSPGSSSPTKQGSTAWPMPASTQSRTARGSEQVICARCEKLRATHCAVGVIEASPMTGNPGQIARRPTRPVERVGDLVGLAARQDTAPAARGCGCRYRPGGAGCRRADGRWRVRSPSKHLPPTARPCGGRGSGWSTSRPRCAPAGGASRRASGRCRAPPPPSPRRTGRAPGRPRSAHSRSGCG